MIRRWFWGLVDYIDGWLLTRQIKRNNPELYKFLCSEEGRDLENYVEAERPEETWVERAQREANNDNA